MIRGRRSWRHYPDCRRELDARRDVGRLAWRRSFYDAVRHFRLSDHPSADYDDAMSEHTETCWTMIEGAARGEDLAREHFARQYGPVIDAYLKARWRGVARTPDGDDALQEVFLECFKSGGALERVERRRAGGFRAFLYGVTRNVTRRIEERTGRRREETLATGLDPADDEKDLARVFERAWALQTVREAARRQRAKAKRDGPEAERRAELLRMRFQEGRPIRDIAKEWDVDAAALHRDYAKARKEFEVSLRELVAFDFPGSADDVEAESRSLLRLLN